MSTALNIRLARVYEHPVPEDGVRVLVDRLWPRGMHRDDPRLGRWFKEVAPSNDLRKWYDHQPERHDEFCRRYREELAAPAMIPALDELRGLAKPGPLTLTTATAHIEDSELPVLKAVLEEQ